MGRRSPFTPAEIAMNFWIDFAGFALRSFWIAAMIALVIVVPIIIGARTQKRRADEVRVTSLDDRYDAIEAQIRAYVIADGQVLGPAADCATDAGPIISSIGYIRRNIAKGSVENIQPTIASVASLG